MSLYRFSNGLRLIVEPSDSRVLYCGYLILAGTRHEADDEYGMAHFIEHMSFKGTEHRRSTQINNYLECVGGELNAFTNKQETVYHATVLCEEVARAVELLTDIVFHSIYPQAEIVKEVEVIVDEIESYRDTPTDLIFDEFEQMIFTGHPLGRDILGRAERLRQYTTADARRFAAQHYRPDNAVFYCYGAVNEAWLIRRLEQLHHTVCIEGTYPERSEEVLEIHDSTVVEVPSPYAPAQERTVEKGTHQCHVMLGAPTFGSADPRRHALLLLNNILGGPGMNSRLNLEVRERRGLVYSIDSYLNTYPDAGYWNVYFGCDVDDVARCLRLVRRELRRLAETPLTETALRRAQRQLCGQIGIAADQREGHALAMAKTFAYFDCHRDVGRVLEGVRAVTAEQLRQLAQDIYAPERISTLIYR